MARKARAKLATVETCAAEGHYYLFELERQMTTMEAIGGEQEADLHHVFCDLNS